MDERRKEYKPLKIEPHYFGCACFSDEHIVIFHYDPEEGDLWLDVHLGNFPWYKRLWQAIKHIFGYKCKYGCFDTWQINPDDVDRMIELLQKKKAFEANLKTN